MAGLLDFLGIKPGPAPTAFQTTGNNYAPWPPTPPVATPFAPAGGLALGAPPAAPNPADFVTPYRPIGLAAGLARTPVNSGYVAQAPGIGGVAPAPNSAEAQSLKPVIPPTRGLTLGAGALPTAAASAAGGMATPAGSSAPAAGAAPGRTGPIEIVRGGVSDQGGGGLNLNQMRVLLSGNRPRITPSEGAMFQVLGIHESNREKALAQNEANYQNLLRAASGNPDLLAKAEEARMTGASSAISEYLKAIKPVMGLGYSQANLFPDVAAAGFVQ